MSAPEVIFFRQVAEDVEDRETGVEKANLGHLAKGWAQQVEELAGAIEGEVEAALDEP